MSSATTATPVARLAVIGSPGLGPGTTTTARTPGTARAAVSSSRAMSPSKYGQRSMTAVRASGS